MISFVKINASHFIVISCLTITLTKITEEVLHKFLVICQQKNFSLFTFKSVMIKCFNCSNCYRSLYTHMPTKFKRIGQLMYGVCSVLCWKFNENFVLIIFKHFKKNDKRSACKNNFVQTNKQFLVSEQIDFIRYGQSQNIKYDIIISIYILYAYTQPLRII